MNAQERSSPYNHEDTQPTTHSPCRGRWRRRQRQTRRHLRRWMRCSVCTPRALLTRATGAAPGPSGCCWCSPARTQEGTVNRGVVKGGRRREGRGLGCQYTDSSALPLRSVMMTRIHCGTHRTCMHNTCGTAGRRGWHESMRTMWKNCGLNRCHLHVTGYAQPHGQQAVPIHASGFPSVACLHAVKATELCTIGDTMHH